MIENKIFAELEKVNDNASSKQIETVYNQIFTHIAHDHSGVYYAEKIEWIEKLVEIYQQTINNPKKSTLISAILNNLYFFEPDNQNPQTTKQVKDLLAEFADDSE